MVILVYFQVYFNRTYIVYLFYPIISSPPESFTFLITTSIPWNEQGRELSALATVRETATVCDPVIKEMLLE